MGHLVMGVLRLHGTTDLRNQKITAAYNHTGQIVGNNENGLVYATGNGSGLYESNEGWKLIRYSDQDRSGSDIGNWGAVVRLGEKLTEGTDGVLSFAADAHTVKVNNGTGTNIKDANAFAAYALAFDLSKAYASTESAALSFAATVNPSSHQAVTLAGNIDLTGTGILGIGKDSLEKMNLHRNSREHLMAIIIQSHWISEPPMVKMFQIQIIMQQVSFMQREVMRGMHIIVWR